VTDQRMQRDADRLRAALADGPRSVGELGELAKGFVGHVGLWVDLVRAPPSGTGSGGALTSSPSPRTGSAPVT
jgi:hypothetical protein